MDSSLFSLFNHEIFLMYQRLHVLCMLYRVMVGGFSRASTCEARVPNLSCFPEPKILYLPFLYNLSCILHITQKRSVEGSSVTSFFLSFWQNIFVKSVRMGAYWFN